MDESRVGLNVKPDEPTVNGRIYPRAVFDKALADYAARVREGEVFGAFLTDPYPDARGEIPPDRRAFRVLDLETEDDGTAVVLLAVLPETAPGRRLAELIQAGRASITTGGIGDVGEDGVIQEGFQLTHVAAIDPDLER